MANGEQLFIELVDTRGLLNESNVAETRNIVGGDVPVNTQIERFGDAEYIAEFTSAFPQKAERFHLTILCVPTDLPQEKASLYVQLRNTIKQSMHYTPFLPLYTPPS
jgi:hypothetical protein